MTTPDHDDDELDGCELDYAVDPTPDDAVAQAVDTSGPETE